jgi:hypothetical protein
MTVTKEDADDGSDQTQHTGNRRRSDGDGRSTGRVCAAGWMWLRGRFIDGGIELRTAVTAFAEIVVSPEPSERSRADVPALEIDIGRDIRVRISATAPAELATAVIKVLAPR